MRYKVYPNVSIGENAQIGDYVIIGLPPIAKEQGELKTVVRDNAVIRSHTVIYAGSIIGSNLRTGHGVMIREECTVGDNVSLGTHSIVEHHVRIGNGVRIHSHAFIPEYSFLEERCWIGPNVVLTNVLHPSCPKAKECWKGPTIRRDAKVGANATILADITIGVGALVGAGAVVVADVPDGKVVVGNPARVIKDVSELICPYQLIDRPYVEERL